MVWLSHAEWHFSTAVHVHIMVSKQNVTMREPVILCSQFAMFVSQHLLIYHNLSIAVMARCASGQNSDRNAVTLSLKIVFLHQVATSNY